MPLPLFHCLVALILIGTDTQPGRWQPISSPVEASLRGVYAVDADVAWFSGAQGTILKTVDGGRSFQSRSIPGTDKFDFRDIHAWNEDAAVVMVAGQPARFYRTDNGGRDWELAYEDSRPETFFDAMDFWDEEHGIAFSDPIDGELVVITTADGGRNWRSIEFERSPNTVEGEHGYAASGTCLATFADRGVLIGLGGAGHEGRFARVTRSTDAGKSWTAASSALPGSASAGVFSIKMMDANRGVLVGGDYSKEDDQTGNLATTADGGVSWKAASDSRPHGYRSAIDGFRADDRWYLITAGPNGCDYSSDGGQTWHALEGAGYHAIDFAEDQPVGWAVGSEGRIAKWGE